MKTLQTVLLAAFASQLLLPAAFAKKPPLTLAAFAGRYTGTVTLRTPSDTQAGTAAVTITTPKKGRSATIVYSALVFDGTDNKLLPTQLTLAKDKTLAVTDLGIGIAGTNNAHRGTGAWSQQKHALALSATNGDINFRGSAIAKDAGRKRRLTLTLITSDADGSNPYIFTTTLVAKLPKVKK